MKDQLANDLLEAFLGEGGIVAVGEDHFIGGMYDLKVIAQKLLDKGWKQ
jgi:hypothetical protein